MGIAVGVGARGADGLEGLGGGELARGGDDDGLGGAVGLEGAGVLDLADEGLAGDDLAEDDVLAVEVGGGDGGDEELGAVGVCVVSSSPLLLYP